jgi:hypothetical protein
MAEKHEIYLAVDSQNNAAVGWGVEETMTAINSWKTPPVRVMCLSVAVDAPKEGDSQDHIGVIDVTAPPQPADDGEELPAEEEEPAAPPVTPEEQPAAVAA